MSLPTQHIAMLCRGLRIASKLHAQTSMPQKQFCGLRSVCSSAIENKPPIIESTEEYKFVERLIPPSRVPTPPKHEGRAPSGWSPPSEVPPTLPYMIRRSRMHNVPVYTDITNGSRKMTLLRKVEGDIWALERDVKEFLKQVTGKELPTQVNEVTMTLRVKGHFDQELKEWLLKKGF
ncbi:large ribosomal subunit protein mL49 [Aplochiton taeniatus]